MESKVHNVQCIRVININAHANIVDFSLVFLYSVSVNTFIDFVHSAVAVQEQLELPTLLKYT